MKGLLLMRLACALAREATPPTSKTGDLTARGQGSNGANSCITAISWDLKLLCWNNHFLKEFSIYFLSYHTKDRRIDGTGNVMTFRALPKVFKVLRSLSIY